VWGSEESEGSVYLRHHFHTKVSVAPPFRIAKAPCLSADNVAATSTAKNIPIFEGFKSHTEMQLMLQRSVVFFSSQIKTGGKNN